MFDLNHIFLLSILTIFSIFSIYQDVKKRKVSNYITYSLFLISIAYFMLNISNLVWYDYLTLVLIFPLSFFLFNKDIWGAGDGKIFIALSLFLIGLGGLESMLKYAINLAVIYSISITIIAYLNSHTQQRKNIIMRLNYFQVVFMILTMLLLMTILLSVVEFDPANLYAFLFLIVGALVFSDILKKKFFRKIRMIDEESKILVVMLLFLPMVLLGGYHFLIAFILILSIRILLLFIIELTGDLKKEKNYQSPFTIYLFGAAILTILINIDIVTLVVRSLFL